MFYAFSSFYRMVAAYALSFVFAISYGYAAASSKRAERLLLPVLDILQSVPVLGFFPVAVLFLVSLFKGSLLGVELAAIFLIFTSQAWNMAFGVYESLITIPPDLIDATASLGTSAWQRFKRLLFPACAPKLVYNSMLSWAGGWYFLIACEIIVLGPVKKELPGLGSYLIKSAAKGDVAGILLGLGAMVAIIVTMDVLLWRPLQVWADKFTYQYEYGPGAPRRTSSLLELVSSIAASGWTAPARHFLARTKDTLASLLRAIGHLLGRHRWRAFLKKLTGALKVVIWVGVVVGLGLALASLGAWLIRGAAEAFPLAEARAIPLAISLSFLRLLAAYVVALAWTIPVAVLIGRSEQASRLLTPVVEVAASVPATALFPLIVLFVIRVTGGSMDAASILLVLTGMQWYLLFNLIAGVRTIPRDLSRAVQSYGAKRRLYWKRLILPAIFPSLITGSITAWGGGWNALIVSEYLVFKGKTYTAFGIGMLLDKAVYGGGGTRAIVIILLSMVLAVIFMNRLIWRPLYKLAVQRDKMEQ